MTTQPVTLTFVLDNGVPKLRVEFTWKHAVEIVLTDEFMRRVSDYWKGRK